MTALNRTDSIQQPRLCPQAVERLLNKRQLAEQLNLPSTRIIDSWVKKRMISSIRAGYRTRLFKLSQVLEDLSRFEIKAVGRRDK